MALKSQEMKQRLRKIEMEQKAILDEAKDVMSKDQEEKFDKLQNEFETLEKQAAKIEAIEQREVEEAQETKEIEKTLKKGDLDPEKKKQAESLAMREFMLTGRVSPELHEFMRPAKGEKGELNGIYKELEKLGIRAAQQSTSDGSGGYTIPQGFQAELETAMKAYGGMQQVSRIWRTSTGNTVDWPTMNDTNNKAYQLSEAGNAETSAAKLTDANQQFEAYKFTTGLIRVSAELIEDSAFNMPGVINEAFAERVGRGINYECTLSDGSSKPKGITVAAAHGNNTADDQALAYDDWIDLIHEIDPAYRPQSTLMFHDTVLKTLKKLKDSQNQPVWLPSMRDGEPATLFGYRYVVNQDMAQWTTPVSASNNDSKKIALFGNFNKYIIRLVSSMRMVRLNERFGDTDEIGFVLFFRMDGDLLDAGTHPVKYMRVSAT